MGGRKVTIAKKAARGISVVAWFIESKGMLATADKFIDEAHDFISTIGNDLKSYSYCRDPKRATLGYKCIPYKKKYTIVFTETSTEIIVCEFISSKRIYW